MFRDEYNISSVSSARNQTPNPNAKLPILPKASTAHFYLYHSITDKIVITVAKARKIIEKSQSKLHSHFAEKKNEIESKQTASIKEQEETRRKSYKPVPSHDPVYQRAVRLRAEQRSAGQKLMNTHVELDVLTECFIVQSWKRKPLY